MTDLTAEHVRSLLDYDSQTGIFTWKADVARNRKAGRTAGGLSTQGYVVITIKGQTYKAHRLAWLHVYGNWPDSMLDHINQIRSDNRIANLRLANHVLNGKNRRANKGREGVTGATYIPRRNRWVSVIHANNRRIYLGSFMSKDDAVAVYAAAKEKFHAIG